MLEHLGFGCRDSGLLFGLATQIVSMAIPIQKFGSDELKERYLRRLIDGEILSRPRDLRAGRRLRRHRHGRRPSTSDGDEYVLNGKKAWCTSGPIADVLTVYAKGEGDDAATSISAFIVERDTPGLDDRRADPEDGARHVAVRR